MPDNQPPSNVVVLGIRDNNSIKVTPEQMLEDVLAQRRVGTKSMRGSRMIVIALDEGQARDEYNIDWCQTGMRNSEILALLEVAKMDFLERLRDEDLEFEAEEE